MCISSIAIVLGDNDFGMTFEPVLKSIAAVLVNDPYIPRHGVEYLIRESIKFHYIAYQRRDLLSEQVSMKDYLNMDSTIKYLLEGIKIFFDDTADKKCLREDHDGGAWYLNVPSGQITYF